MAERRFDFDDDMRISDVWKRNKAASSSSAFIALQEEASYSTSIVDVSRLGCRLDLLTQELLSVVVVSQLHNKKTQLPVCSLLTAGLGPTDSSRENSRYM